MYLGSQLPSESSVLQLTGQLIITQPVHLQHLQPMPYQPYTMPSYTEPTPQPAHYQPVRSPLPLQYLKKPPQCLPPQANHPSQQQLQPKPAQQQALNDGGEHAEEKKESGREERLEERTEHVRDKLDNISKVNCQTLRAFREIQLEISDRMAAQNRVWAQRMQKVEDVESKLEKKGQQFLDSQERKFDMRRQELEVSMEEKVKEFLQQTVKVENIREENSYHLTQQMNRLQTSAEEKMQETEQKMKEKEQKIQEMEQKMKKMEEAMEKLEFRVQLKIKEEINRLETLEKEAQKRSQEQIKLMKNQLREIQMQSEEGEQLKAKRKRIQAMEKPEQSVMKTPSTHGFTINRNTITRSSGKDGQWRMVMLDVVAGQGVFSFRTQVHKLKGWMYIGVTDRVTQKERHWAQEEHSIVYACYGGNIYYATGDGKHKQYDDGVRVDDGMKLLCKVERDKCQVTFNVQKQPTGFGQQRTSPFSFSTGFGEQRTRTSIFSTGLGTNPFSSSTQFGQERMSTYKRQVSSPILSHSHREFVPFFVMDTKGDSISWELL